MLENSQMRENMLLQYADDIIKVEMGSLRGEMLRLVGQRDQRDWAIKMSVQFSWKCELSNSVTIVRGPIRVSVFYMLSEGFYITLSSCFLKVIWKFTPLVIKIYNMQIQVVLSLIQLCCQRKGRLFSE